MRHILTRASILTLMLAVLPTLVLAQSGGATAEIKGKVTDANGGGVPGVSVTVTDAAKGISRTVTSDGQGEYRVLSLPPGTYQLKVEAKGFKTQVLNEAQVTVGQIAQRDFTLEVGAVTEMINITSEAPVIESERTQQSNTINEQAIRNLPIDRRDYLTYTLLAPGVVDSNALADNADFRVSQTPQSGLSFYGNNGRGNSITVDGAEANEANGGVRPTLGQDAVQEFQVNRSNYNAELGGASGGVINIVSKTGTNNVRGNVFGFFRNQKLDAGDPFAIVFNRATNTATRVKPAANRQQIGGSIGFPIAKDKAFAFVSYEHLRRRESSAVPLLTSTSIFNPTAAQTALINALAANTSTTPVPCLRGGIPNVTGGSPTNPADIVNATPSACAALLRGALTTHAPVQNLFFNNSGVFPFSADSDAFSGRVDYNLSEKNVFFGRYNFTKSDEANQSTRALLGFSRSNNVDTLDHTAVAGWTHIFNSDLINEVRVQGNYRRFLVISNDPHGPEYNVSGFGFFNRDIFLPHTTYERRAEFADNLSYSTGKHKFKFGGNLLIHGGYFDPATFFAGRFFFDPQPAAVAGALVSPCLANPQSCGAAAGVGTSGINSLQALDLGVPRAFQIGFGPNQPGKSITRATLPHYSFYGQDTWNVRPNLTLNYGLRYEVDQRKKPLRTSKNNFGPRVGLAWDPFKDGKTSVRAGYGIFYAEIPLVIDYVVTALNELTGPDSGVQTPMLQPNCGGNPCFRQTPNLASVLSPASTATSANNIFRTLLAQGVFLQSNTVRQITEADLAQFGIPVSQTGPRNSLTVLFRADPTYRNPMAQQASFAIDRELSPGLSISASYTWVLTNYLTRARDINLRQRPINTDPAVGPVGIRLWSGASGCAGAGVFNCFVNPTIFQEIIYESSQSAAYNGGIFEVQKRFSNKLSFAANYTYSKAFDQVTDYNSDFRAMDQTDQDGERALSAFDQRHKFVAYAVIQSPYKNALVRDFTLTPIFRANSGRPFNLLAGSDVNADRSGNGDRPPLVARNTGKGPNFWTLDMRVGRQIGLGAETRSLELTFEVFNLFNRLNYSSVNNFVGPDTPCGLLPAGTPLSCNPDLAGGNVTGRHDRSPSQSLGFTGAFDPRRIQLGARFRF